MRENIEKLIKRILESHSGNDIKDIIIDHEIKIKIALPILLHHFRIARFNNVQELNEIINKYPEYALLSAILAHPIDIISSSVYGFIRNNYEKMVKEISEKISLKEKFIRVNPFTRIKLGETKLIKNSSYDKLKNNIIEDYKGMDPDNIVKLYSKATERTYEPALDISLQEHARFSSLLALLVLLYILENNSGEFPRELIKGYKEISIGKSKELLKQIFRNIRLSWFVIDLTNFDKIIYRAKKFQDIYAYNEFVSCFLINNVKQNILTFFLEKYNICDEDLRSLISFLIPFISTRRIVIVLLPYDLTNDINNYLYSNLIDTIVKDFEVRKEEAKRLINTYISIGSKDVIFDEISSIKDIARILRKGLEDAFRSLSSPGNFKVLEFNSNTCWYCRVNSGKPIKFSNDERYTYRYGMENVPIYRCNICDKIINNFTARDLKVRSISYYADDKNNIALIRISINHNILNNKWKFKKIQDFKNNLSFMFNEFPCKCKEESLTAKILEKIIKCINKNIIDILKVLDISERKQRIGRNILSQKREIGCCYKKFEEFRKFVGKSNKILFLLIHKAENLLWNINNKLFKDDINILCKDKELLGLLWYSKELEREIESIKFFINQYAKVETIPLSKFYSLLKVPSNSDLELNEELGFINHLSRISSRYYFLLNLFKRIESDLKNGNNKLFTVRGDDLIIICPGYYIWNILEEIINILNRYGFTQSFLSDMVWNSFENVLPALSISVYLMKHNYPLYRVLEHSKLVSVVPLDYQCPLRVFVSDIRGGFDPGIKNYYFIPFSTFYILFDKIKSMKEDDIIYIHRIISKTSFYESQSSLAYILYKRQFSHDLNCFLKLFIDYGLDENLFYYLYLLVNFKRYSIG